MANEFLRGLFAGVQPLGPNIAEMLHLRREGKREEMEQRRKRFLERLGLASKIAPGPARRTAIGQEFAGTEYESIAQGLAEEEPDPRKEQETEATRQEKMGDIRRQVGTDIQLSGASPESIALHPELIGGPIEPQEGETVADYLKRTQPVESEYQVTAPLVQKHQQQATDAKRQERLATIQNMARTAITPEGKKAVADLLRAEGFEQEATATSAEAGGRQEKADTAAGARMKRETFNRVDRLIRAGVPDEAANILESAGLSDDAEALRAATKKRGERGLSDPLVKEILARSFQYYVLRKKSPNPISFDQAVTEVEAQVKRLSGPDPGVQAAAAALKGLPPDEQERQLEASQSLTPEEKDQVRKLLNSGKPATPRLRIPGLLPALADTLRKS
jgi:hypothetical protein